MGKLESLKDVRLRLGVAGDKVLQRAIESQMESSVIKPTKSSFTL